MSELKSCLYCEDGGSPELVFHFGYGFVCCNNCKSRGPQTTKPKEAVIAWNTRKPELGQPAAVQTESMGVDEFNAIHGPTFMGEPVIDPQKKSLREFVEDEAGYFLYGDMAIRYLRQKLEKPAAGQSEPVAKVGLKAHTLEWLSDEAFDSVPIGALLYTHPIPAAPAVPEGWKFRKMDFGIAITQPGKGPYCALPQGHGASSLTEAILNNLGMAILAAAPNQQDVAK